jgi:hypothetical protein
MLILAKPRRDCVTRDLYLAHLNKDIALLANNRGVPWMLLAHAWSRSRMITEAPWNTSKETWFPNIEPEPQERGVLQNPSSAEKGAENSTYLRNANY